MIHHQPTDLEIRKAVTSLRDKQLRLLFMYQYEVLGRISEVAGKYMPHRDDSVLMDVDGEEFVVFIAKTAKRRGRLRPCAVPLNKEYDPWASEIYDYIQGEEEHPFSLHENVETSKTYGMKHARRMFDGMWWPMVDYTSQSERPYTEDLIISKRFGDKGFEEYLVVFSDRMRSWTTSKEVVKFSVKVEERWKRATSHVLRKRRTLTLANDYLFDGIDLAYAGGWTEHTQSQDMPPALKFYMFMSLRSSREALPQLKKQARRYAKKLLVPYDLFNK